MATPGTTAPGYRAHAAALVAVLPAARRDTCRRRPGARGQDDLGGWGALGLLLGAALLAAACCVALAGHPPTVADGGLLSAVPGDAAFGTAVRDATADMAPYESASSAADLPEPDAWAPEFISRAVEPALGRLTTATPPVHLRAPTESAISALDRVRAELGGYDMCRAHGGGCSTQRHALDHAVDEAYRLLGDLSLYTFG